MDIKNLRKGGVYRRPGKEANAKVLDYTPGASLLRFTYTEGAGKDVDFYQEPAAFAEESEET